MHFKSAIEARHNARRQSAFEFKGIANRDFNHEFTLAETVVVRSADIENGLLIVRLENVIPEEKLPRKILIGGGTKMLVENSEERQAA